MKRIATLLGGAAMALACVSGAQAQQIPDGAYAPNGGYRATQPTVVMGQVYSASGVAPLIGACTGAGSSAVYVPIAGRPMNIQVTGTWAGAWHLARSLNGVTAPVTVSVAGTSIQMEQGTADASDTWSEAQYGVSYYFVCDSVSSGTLSYSISQ